MEELLTKAEKRLIPNVPDKIGETYYREIQAPGNVKWYFGGGTVDQPLNEDTVQEKIAKTQEKAKEFNEKRSIEKEELEQWQKDRLKALEVNDDDRQKQSEETLSLNEGEVIKINHDNH